MYYIEPVRPFRPFYIRNVRALDQIHRGDIDESKAIKTPPSTQIYKWIEPANLCIDHCEIRHLFWDRSMVLKRASSPETCTILWSMFYIQSLQCSYQYDMALWINSHHLGKKIINNDRSIIIFRFDNNQLCYYLEQ